MATTTNERITYAAEVIFQQILAVFVLLIIWELFRSGYSSESKVTWHIVFCVIGIALCMAEGVQMFRKQSIVSFGDTRESKRKAHLSVMLFAFICLTIGISLIISQKEDLNVKHFLSTHGKLGLSTWIIAFVTALGGFVAYQANTCFFLISPKIIKIIHTFVGLTAYLLGVSTLIYGMEYLMGGQTRGWVFLVVLLVIYVAYSVIQPFISLFNYLTDR